MRRREFITLLGGAAAWPLAAPAQTGKLVRLGYLDGGARADPTTQNLRRQFVLGMRDLGYNEARDYLLEERYAAGHLDTFPTYAHELVELPVDMIVAGGEAAIRAAKRATSQIPIVMTLAADPIGSGLVPNLAHPGGNLMSALASDLAGKRVELLKELVPKAKRVAVLCERLAPLNYARAFAYVHPIALAIDATDILSHSRSIPRVTHAFVVGSTVASRHVSRLAVLAWGVGRGDRKHDGCGDEGLNHDCSLMVVVLGCRLDCRTAPVDGRRVRFQLNPIFCVRRESAISQWNRPTRQLSLRPVAIGAVVEVTKRLKPSV
jgi:hypothetical protein